MRNMDGVALASVITSGAVGVSGLGLSLWTQRQAARLAREQRLQGRLEKAYLDVLTHVELEGLWAQSTYRNMELAIEDRYESVERVQVDRPSPERRAEAGALLRALGSDEANDAFLDWRREVDAMQEAREILVWNFYESGNAPNDPPDRVDVDRMKVIAQREATRRSALGAVVAAELRGRS